MKRYLNVHSVSIMMSVVVSLTSSEISSDANGCPRNLPYTSGMELFHGTCYQFVSQEKFWPQAKDHCLRNGGRLVKIADQRTNEFIAEKLDGLWWRNNGVWIGLHDITSEMRWQWTGFELYQNEPALWTNWGRGHPGAFLHAHRDCVRMVRNDGWRWHETFCDSMRWQYRFICEYNASGRGHAAVVNERRLRGQSSLNIMHHRSIDTADTVAHRDGESIIISGESIEESAMAFRADEEIVSNEGGFSKSAIIIAVAGVFVLGGTLALVALFMFYHSRRRRSEKPECPAENRVGSKGKKFDDDALTEANSFRPAAAAVSNIYVEADTRGRVTEVRLAEETSEEEEEADGGGGYDSSDDETGDDIDDSGKRRGRVDDTVPCGGLAADAGYDALGAANIYSEIPDGNGDCPDGCHIYEALEDVRK